MYDMIMKVEKPLIRQILWEPAVIKFMQQESLESIVYACKKMKMFDSSSIPFK